MLRDIFDRKGKLTDFQFSELRYRRIFDTAQDGILLLDFKTGMILDVNKFLIDLLGYSKKDFLKKYVWEVGVFKNVIAQKENLKTIQEKKYVRFENLPLETKRGKIINVEFVANAYKGAEAMVIQCNIRDITKRVKMEEAVLVSELRYRRLFETAKDGILILDFKTGKINDINKYLLDLLGYSKKDILKKKVWEIGLFKDEEEQKNNLYILQKKKYVRFENLPLETKKGKRINVEFIANAYEVGGEMVIQCDIRNITDRVKVEEALTEMINRDEAILGSIGDAVLVCDETGKIILFNRVAEVLTGIKTKNALGHHYNQIIHLASEITGKSINDFIGETIKINKTTTMVNDVFLARKDGKKIPVADSAAPVININSKKVIGCVVVFRDVTKERSIDRAKTELISLASHQMRTPLSVISWYVEFLRSDDYGLLNDKQTEFATEIFNASKRMTTMVNSLLNVSRLDMGTFTIEPKMVDLIDVAKTNAEIFKLDIQMKKIILDEEYGKNIKPFLADPKLLGIIFQNLLSNAIKYSHPGGKIVLKVREENNLIGISISDTGVGIPEYQKSKVFTKLFRADNAAKIDPSGTGLGLYIVSEIVSHSGGKVWFESSENKGTTFFVAYPLTGMTKKVGSKPLI